MDKKVYYGEYSLKHWIELLLKKDLELPPYQRNFVWLEEQVRICEWFERGNLCTSCNNWSM